MKTITIPSSIKTVESDAFYGTSVERIDIHDLNAWMKIDFEAYSLGYEDDDAHPGCGGKAELYLNGEIVREVIVPDDITELDDMAFLGIESLTNVVCHDNVKRVGSRAFYSCGQLNECVLPKREETFTLGTRLFCFCASLSKINLPENASCISAHMFQGTGLTSISIPSSVKRIYDYAFYQCNKLTEMHIPEGVEMLYARSFSNCSNLEIVSLPSTLSYIGPDAFTDCVNLNTVFLASPIPSTVSDSSFSGCDSLTIFVPYEQIDSYRSDIHWASYAHRIVGYDFENDKVVE